MPVCNLFLGVDSDFKSHSFIRWCKKLGTYKWMLTYWEKTHNYLWHVCHLCVSVVCNLSKITLSQYYTLGCSAFMHIRHIMASTFLVTGSKSCHLVLTHSNLLQLTAGQYDVWALGTQYTHFTHYLCSMLLDVARHWQNSYMWNIYCEVTHYQNHNLINPCYWCYSHSN